MLLCRSHKDSTACPRLTAEALSSLATKEKSQLQTWYEEPQAHEKLVVGHDTGRGGKEMSDFFKEVDKSVQNTKKKDV